MDTIKFKLTEPTLIEGSNLKCYDVKVILNGQQLPHSIFNAAEALSVYEFKSAEFDLFTCSCGVAGCAGFHDYVLHKKSIGEVIWTFPQEDYYKTDQKVYTFKQEQFDFEFKALKEKMLSLEKERVHHETMLSDEGLYEEENSKAVMTAFELQKSLDWWNNLRTADANFNEFLLKNFPQEVQTTFSWVYDGEKSKESHDFASIVKRLLNKYPKNAKEPNYLKKVKKSGTALVQLLKNNDKDFKSLANKSYSVNGLTPYCIIEFDFRNHPSLTEDNFNIEKLNLHAG